MSRPDKYSFVRYLEAKASVDDRALNARVWDEMAAGVAAYSGPKLRALEIGGGIGTMLTRLLSQDVLPACEYTLVDQQAENISRARDYLKAWSRDNGYSWVEQGENRFDIEIEGQTHQIELVTANGFDFLQQTSFKWDLLICHAFLDLIDLSTGLKQLLSALRPNGMYYFTINYDGDTIIEPEIDAELDRSILARYDRTMDQRVTAGKISGDSRTGRHLFEALRIASANILAAGSSDWVVYPSEGKYPSDEAYFLHFLVNTIEGALSDDPVLDRDTLKKWCDRRHSQIEAGELVYIAHQLDFFGRVL